MVQVVEHETTCLMTHICFIHILEQNKRPWSRKQFFFPPWKKKRRRRSSSSSSSKRQIQKLVFGSHSCPVYALSFIAQNLLRVNTQISLPSPHNTNNNKRYDPKTETGTLFDSKPLPFGSNKKQREKKKPCCCCLLLLLLLFLLLLAQWRRMSVKTQTFSFFVVFVPLPSRLPFEWIQSKGLQTYMSKRGIGWVWEFEWRVMVVITF